MWYYALNNQPNGPVDDEKMKNLLQTGIINVNTLVWQEGMPDWKKLGETSLAAPATPPQPAPSLMQTMGQPGQPVPPAATYNPYTATPMTPPTPASQVNPASLRSLFIWCVVLLGIGNLGSAIGSLASDSDAASALTCIVALFAVSGAILLFILLYRFWKLIQDGYASTTPGKAVGFLFIPFFNYYWIFRAVFGLAQDMNKYIDRHFPAMTNPPVRKTKPGLALVYCIFFIINVGFTAFIYANTLSSMSSSSTTSSSISAFSAIFTIIYAVLVILTMADLYQTAKEILEKSAQ